MTVKKIIFICMLIGGCLAHADGYGPPADGYGPPADGYGTPQGAPSSSTSPADGYNVPAEAGAADRYGAPHSPEEDKEAMGIDISQATSFAALETSQILESSKGAVCAAAEQLEEQAATQARKIEGMAENMATGIASSIAEKLAGDFVGKAQCIAWLAEIYYSNGVQGVEHAIAGKGATFPGSWAAKAECLGWAAKMVATHGIGGLTCLF